jgi:hypothetical protein
MARINQANPIYLVFIFYEKNGNNVKMFLSSLANQVCLSDVYGTSISLLFWKLCYHEYHSCNLTFFHFLRNEFFSTIFFSNFFDFFLYNKRRKCYAIHEGEKVIVKCIKDCMNFFFYHCVILVTTHLQIRTFCVVLLSLWLSYYMDICISCLHVMTNYDLYVLLSFFHILFLLSQSQQEIENTHPILQPQHCHNLKIITCLILGRSRITAGTRPGFDP